MRPIAEVRARLTTVLAQPEAVTAADDDVAPAPPAVPALLPWQMEAASAALTARATWPHALLVVGPRGIGKRTLALNFAKALLCETPRADGLACNALPELRLRRGKPGTRTCAWSSRSSATRTARRSASTRSGSIRCAASSTGPR